jgi:purine-binding chemotaxis protein CheW
MSRYLIVEVAQLKCAFALSDVIETMRPLPLTSVNVASEHILGASIIRGGAVPVLDLSRLMGGDAVTPSRFVTLRIGERVAAVAVSKVIAVVSLADDELIPMPKLLPEGDSRALAIHDGELLRILNSTRLLDDETWTQLEQSHSH